MRYINIAPVGNAPSLAMRKAVKKQGLDYQEYDMESCDGMNVASKYGINKFPQMIILDDDGNFVCSQCVTTLDELRDILSL